MTKVNSIGQNILKSRYYDFAETSPEDLFLRVAKVVAIPDVLWEMFSLGKLRECSTNELSLVNVFSPYQETAKRVARREFKCDSHYLTVSGEDFEWASKCWTKHYSKYFELMADLKFMPATPVLINAGKTDMLSSCFFMDIKDSIEEIFDTMKKAAVVMKQGGGVGFDFSDIRPEGSLVSSSGKNSSTGPISYMKIYNSMGDQINQAGVRKSAMMACLSIDHPDIEKFITCKQTEGDLANFNISVITTKEFMDAVKFGSSFTLKHPRSSITKVVDAVNLWDKLLHNAHRNGEPGIQFGDHIAAGDVYGGKYGKLRSNPCQPGFATVLTQEGIRTFDDIDVGSVIWSGKQWTKVINKACTGVKPVCRYKTTAGEFIGTDSHVVISNNTRIEVKNAKTLQLAFAPYSKPGSINPQDVMDGLVFGDGGLHKEKYRNVKILYIGKDDQDYFTSEVSHLIDSNYRAHGDITYKIVTTLQDEELNSNKGATRRIPKRFLYGPRDSVCGFLRGVYSANGSTNGRRITLKTVNLEMLKQIQMMLSSVGINSYVTTNKKRSNVFRNGTYEMNVSYDLNITYDRNKFMNSIGFIQTCKKEKLIRMCHKYYQDKNTRCNPKENFVIREVECLGDCKVYDITVDAAEHTYWTGNMLVSNCSELFLLDRESCALSCINLSELYEFGRDDLDPDELQYVVRTGVRFLDNMVSINNYPLPDTEKSALSTRRIGLGVTGLHDFLLKRKIKYSSDTGVRTAVDIFKTIKAEAQKESEKLAQERGVPAYNAHLNRRNGGLLTCQPAGTVSMIMNQVSSGIEPVFKFEYPRNDSYGSKTIKHWIMDEYKNGSLPPFAETALDIPLDGHIRMQSEIQKLVDASISKTVNLPNSATVDDVKNVYELAYARKCKSVTVYREGSREKEVLGSSIKKVSLGEALNIARNDRNGIDNAVNKEVSDECDLCAEYGREPNEETKKAILDTGSRREVTLDEIRKEWHAPELPAVRERPRVLFGATFCVPTPSGRVYITVNEDTSLSGVREVLVAGPRPGSDLATFTESYGRLISNSLKYNVPVESMIAHLKGQSSSPVLVKGGTIKSVSDAVAVTLEEYISNFEGFSQFIDDPKREDRKAEEKNSLTGKFSGDICPECGESTVYSESGCCSCKNCGYSRCS